VATLMARYFTLEEFLCRCGLDNCDAPPAPHPGLVAMLDMLRDALGEPLVVTSGLRCAAHNAALGGEPASGHLTGTEADVACGSSRVRHRLLAHAYGLGISRIGIYPKHVHLGISSKRSWCPRWSSPR
jgi:uncharacterized protein YcbK (DUF882 family)